VRILTVIVAVLLSLFSTAVMSYISMAIPVGPWIAPTLALIAIVLFGIFCRARHNCSQQIALATIGGSVGGILATALGFYFTTLYFLDADLFNLWLENPKYFMFVISGISLTAGVFGIWVANIFEQKLIYKDKLSFPVAELVNKTIFAQKQARKSLELLFGFVSNTVFCFFRDGLGAYKSIIPTSITLVPKLQFFTFYIPAIRLDFWPMLWALGFVTGHLVAIPLAVGVISKIMLVRPIHDLAFKDVAWMEFMITFCSGMVLASAIFGLFKTPKALFQSIKNSFKKKKLSPAFQVDQDGQSNQPVQADQPKKSFFAKTNVIETIIMSALFFGFLTYFKFSFLSQLYIFLFSFICTYQISIIAGKIGLAPMGKFATFVMVPALFIFSLDYVQVVLIATFVGVCCGVVADILFGRKIAQLADISVSKVKFYQYLGVIVSSLFVGVVFLFLIKHFQLGSKQLFAIRAQNRWMLINTLKNATSFNYYVLILGVIFGFVLSKARVSPLLVLGGLFMPINITLGLVIGGIGALFVKNRERMYPFWSGVYAAGSIWMLIRAIF